MPSISLTYYKVNSPLKEPYVLSFACLTSFESYILVAEGDGRTGFGEVTPLPGYSDETMETAGTVLDAVFEALGQGADFHKMVCQTALDAPFVASGLASAIESWGDDETWFSPLAKPVQLAALCSGTGPEAAALNAGRLYGSGYRTLKMKIGAAPVGEDLARIRAAAAAIGAGAGLRLDANQALSPDQAAALIAGLADLPIDLIEQPFTPDAWDAFRDLAATSTIPLMLDESITDDRDIARAASCGAHWVKLKLCKHAGPTDTLRLLKEALGRGLAVVFGNGVQGPVGNLMEAHIHIQAGLESAGEFNGFAKISEPCPAIPLTIENGTLHGGGADRSVLKAALPRPDNRTVFKI